MAKHKDNKPRNQRHKKKEKIKRMEIWLRYSLRRFIKENNLNKNGITKE